jgi:hypothetical protein
MMSVRRTYRVLGLDQTGKSTVTAIGPWRVIVG